MPATVSRALAGLLVAVAATACQVLSPEETAGSYTLVRAGGAPLPVVVGETAETEEDADWIVTLELTDGLLRLTPDRRFTLFVEGRETRSSGRSVTTTNTGGGTVEGAYLFQDGVLTLQPGEAGDVAVAGYAFRVLADARTDGGLATLTIQRRESPFAGPLVLVFRRASS